MSGIFGNTSEYCVVHVFSEDSPDHCLNCGRNQEECAAYDQAKQRVFDALPWTSYADEWVVSPFRLKFEGTTLPYIHAALLNKEALLRGEVDAAWDLTLDRRFGHSARGDELKRWTWFLATAMAIAAGYDKFTPGNTRLDRAVSFTSLLRSLEGETSATAVVVQSLDDGWSMAIPYLEAHPQADRQVMLALDKRFFFFTTPEASLVCDP